MSTLLDSKKRTVRRIQVPAELFKPSMGRIRGGYPPELEKLPSKLKVVSMFSGCGGLDLGFRGDFTFKGEYFERLSFDVIAAYDNDAKAVVTHNLNLGSIQSKFEGAATARTLDLTDPAATEGMPKAEILIGGFPCQDFSSCGPKRGLSSERGRLYEAMVRYMQEKKPVLVVGENVPHIRKIQDGKALAKILEDIRNAGYKAEAWILHASDFGVPQDRIRVFIVAVRNDFADHFGLPRQPVPTHPSDHRTIDWAISDLEKISDDSIYNQSQYFKAAPATKGNGQGDEKNIAGYPAYTIRAHAHSRVQFHYKLNRRLTIRECARLQTFPDDFNFPHSATTNLIHIGNAVPPVFAYRVASAIESYLKHINRKLK